MARLKFIGIIKEADINKYQKCSIDNKLNPISSDQDNIQLKAIPISIKKSKLYKRHKSL